MKLSKVVIVALLCVYAASADAQCRVAPDARRNFDPAVDMDGVLCDFGDDDSGPVLPVEDDRPRGDELSSSDLLSPQQELQLLGRVNRTQKIPSDNGLLNQAVAGQFKPRGGSGKISIRTSGR